MSTVKYVSSGEYSDGVTTDTISEYTVGSGVTVDGTLIKDGQIDLADDKKVLVGTGDDGEFYSSSDDVYIRNITSNKDIILSVNDGGSQKTLVTVNADVPSVDVSNGNLTMGNNNITGVGIVEGIASTTSLLIRGGTANAQRDILLQTVNAAGDTQVTRITIGSDNDSGSSTVTIDEPTTINAATTLGGDATFSAGAARTLSIATDNTEGDALSIVAGSGGTGDVAGGAVNITGGAGGSGGNNVGGAVVIAGGADGGTSTGGAAYIRGGAGDTNGTVYIGDSNTAAVSVTPNITLTAALMSTADAITSVSEGVAASVSTIMTFITTNGDSDLDNVTLAAGTDGQIKTFAVVAVGNAADSVKITPANMIGGTQITFAANPIGLGCVMAFNTANTGWVVVANNGGTIA